MTKVISVFQQGQSLIEHEAISSMIEENIKGMEIHFSRDSVFIFQQNKILDRQKIEQIMKDHIVVKYQEEEKLIQYTFETPERLILILPDRTKFYLKKIST